LCFWHFFETKKAKKRFKNENNFTFVSKTLSFRKYFLNKNIFVLKNFYFRCGNSFTFVCKLKSFCLKNKNNFTFVSKTPWFRKCFLNKNISVLKNLISVSETLSLLFR